MYTVEKSLWIRSCGWLWTADDGSLRVGQRRVHNADRTRTMELGLQLTATTVRVRSPSNDFRVLCASRSKRKLEIRQNFDDTCMTGVGRWMRCVYGPKYGVSAVMLSRIVSMKKASSQWLTNGWSGICRTTSADAHAARTLKKMISELHDRSWET